MSARKWQPGDVAMVECFDGEWRRAFAVRYSYDDGLSWMFPDASLRWVSDSAARPLVVLDPENDEVGNAIPPLVAAHVLAAVTGRELAA